MADTNQLMKTLHSLAQLDIDAVHAYTSAIERIDLVDVRQQLSVFRSDHERHVADLSIVIRNMGGEPPEFKPDFKGFAIQGFTAIRSMMGNEQALKAMKTNEELTNKTYSDALALGFPDDVREVIQKNYSDEQKHLAYVNRCIESRVWEESKRKTA